jgi:mycothiol synthase
MQMPFAIAPLAAADLDEARAVLAGACAFDDAARVADEKLRGPGPQGPAAAWLARDAGGAAIGVAAAARGRGVGSALLEHAEVAVQAAGHAAARAVAQPGNYLAPGIDERNAATIAWLERRGWARGAERTGNLIAEIRGNPRVSAARADQLAAAARTAGYEIRRASPAEAAPLAAAVAAAFGGAWPFEIERALTADPPGVHVALLSGDYAAFAVHDGNNQGLGWFGPAGTWPAHRGRGLGEALLVACLVDVAAAHDTCEIAWVGPRPFYEKAVGIAGERRFWPMTKTFPTPP